MDARLAGTWLTPGVELRFGFDDAHAVTGPHIKGPEGAPFLPAETVFVWRR